MKNRLRLIFCTLTLALLAASGSAQIFSLDTLMWNGSADDRINLVLIPDGYTEAEMDKFAADSRNILDKLMTQTPFMEYDTFFNAVAIRVPSEESGVNHPGTATDVTEPVFPVMTVENRFGSRFDVGSIHRLLVPGKGGDIFVVLAENFPQYDQVMVLVNTPHYGGSGGTFATTSLHNSAPEIAIHEIGHSFARLADEYWAGDQYARETYNMTQETDPSLVRWKNWHSEQGIGIYQNCCTDLAKTYYRPHENCKMRRLGPPFCAVCRERIIDVIYEKVNPIVELTPDLEEIPMAPGDTTHFAIKYLPNRPGTNVVEWRLDTVTAVRADSFSFSYEDFFRENLQLRMTWLDTTPLSRSYWPDRGYMHEKTWTLADCGNLDVAMPDTARRCAGDSLLLVARGGEEYRWTGGITSDSVWVFENGTYSVEIVKGYCRFNGEIAVDRFYPPVLTGPILGPDHANFGEDTGYRVFGQAGSTFNWVVEGGVPLDGQGSDSLLVVWEENPARLCVQEVDSNGCEGEMRCTIVDVLFTSDKRYLPADWSVQYGPNPVGVGMPANIKATLPESGRLHWSLHDAQGRNAVSGSVEVFSDMTVAWELPLHGLLPGTYYLRLELNGSLGWLPWIIQN